jgi:glycosyltransferase involved in cell wall biosynthesis
VKRVLQSNKASGKSIWIICQYAGSKYHGMAYRQYYLAKEFLKRGYSVFIFSGSFSHQFTKLPTVKGNFTLENIDGINYIWVKLPKYGQSKSIGRALSMVLFMLKLLFFKSSKLAKPEVLIVSSPSPFPFLIVQRWAKRYGSKIIFEVRDIWPLTLVELGNFSTRNPFVAFMQFVENLAYKRSDYVVSVLPNAQGHMAAHGMDIKKFRYIPNGIDHSSTGSLVSSSKDRKYHLPKNNMKLVVGYAGALGIANALDSLIQSAKILESYNDILFVLVGDGGEKNVLMRMAENCKNVLFIGAVEKDHIQNVLRQFDVCFISLKKRAIFRFGVSPNKLFDYMYAAKPVLYAVDSGNNPVEEAGCGISAEADSPDSIAAAVLRYYNMSKKERDILGKNGRDFVLCNHTYEKLAEEYIELFN